MKNRKAKIYTLFAAVAAMLAVICFVFPDVKLGKVPDKISPDLISDEIKNIEYTLPVILIESYNFDSLTGLDHVPRYDGDYTPKPKDTTRDIIVFDNENGTNKLTDTPAEKYEDVYMSLRGKSTARYQPKKSFKVKFFDSEGNNEDVSFLDMPADNHFILYSPYIDRSLIRNYLALSLQSEVLEWTPKFRFCEVFVNRAGTDINVEEDYCGVYLLTEKIKKSSNRLNIKEYVMADDFSDQLEEGGGLIWKVDWKPGQRDSEIAVAEAAQESWYSLVSLEEGRDSEEEIECAKNEVLLLDDILQNGSDEELEKYFDLESIANVMLIDEMMKCHEGFAGSTFFYRRAGEKVKVIQWDFDLGTGNIKNQGCEGFWTMDYWEFARMFLKHENFREVLLSQWSKLRESTLSAENITSIIQEADIRLEGAWQRNDEKYGKAFTSPPFGTEGNGLTNSKEEREFINDFLVKRGNWIDENLESFLDTFNE